MNLQLNSDRFNTSTKTEVNDQCGELINAAPATLNTLFELATVLGTYANYVTTIQNQITAKANVGVAYSITQMDQWLTGIASVLNNKALASDVHIE